MNTPERMRDFVDLVRCTRRLQQLFRSTLDYRVKREMERLEFQLDRDAGYLAAELVAEPTAAKTGGAA